MSLIPVPAQHIQVEFKPYLDYRLRVERRLDRDFLSSRNDDRSDAFNRLRPGVEWTYGKQWSGEVQYQFSHDEVWRSSRISSDESSDLNLAYAKYKDGKSEITVGRQKINIGSERLIGALEWSMTGRAYDGLRVKNGRWDAYAFKVGVAYPKPGRTRILGSSYLSPYGLTSLIFKHDDQASPSTDIWTLSHHWQAKSGKWNFDLEGAAQTGRATGKSLRAWAFHANASYSFAKATRGYIEVNAASGGSNSDTTNTFDNLLPTNHKFYGSMDLQSWRNMEEIALGVDHQLNPKWNLRAHLHSFALRDQTDAWYGAGGSPNIGGSGAFVDPTGGSGRDIGRELDIEFGYKHSARTSVAAGLGWFFPGGFVKARNGGSANTQTWAFLMLQMRF